MNELLRPLVAGCCNGTRPTILIYLSIGLVLLLCSCWCVDAAFPFLTGADSISFGTIAMSQSTQSLEVMIIDGLVFGQTDQWDGNGEHHPVALISWRSLALLLWFQEGF